MTRIPVGLLLLFPLLPGCASTREFTPVPMPQGIYRYTVVAEGQQYEGTVDLGEDVLVTTESGICRPLDRATEAQRSRIYKERKLRINCGVNLVLEWDRNGEMRNQASAQVPVTRTRERQGECVRWQTLREGRPSCVAYARVVESFTRWVDSTASVRRAG